MVYAVPLEDGSFGLAQAIDAMMVNVIYVAIFSNRFSALPPTPPEPLRTAAVAVLATWRQALNRGEWPALGLGRLAFQKSECPNERFASKGYIGAKHYDAGLIATFLSAYHGLVPWNAPLRPRYYDEMLLPGVVPSAPVVLSPAELSEYRRRSP